MTRTTYNKRLILFLVTVGALFFLLSAQTAFAESIVETTITDVDTEITENYKESISDSVTIAPAYGRPVELYIYNGDQKQWILKRTFMTENTAESKVKIKYPDNWKAHAKSRWKIFVPEAQLTNADIISLAASSEATTTLHNKFLNCKTAAAMSVSSGALLYDLHKDKKRKIASLTKLMTSLILLESKKTSYKIKIKKKAIKEVSPWQYGFRSGDSMSAKKAIYAMMIHSCNEVAASIGLKLNGSSKSFARRMNRRAKALGMKKTVYTNAHGLDSGKKQDSGNYSTAYDQAVLGRYIMKSSKASLIRKAMGKKSKTIKTRKGKYTLYTTNEILGKDGNIGMKAGTERYAKNCFTGAFRYKGKVYITVILGASSESSRWSNTQDLQRFVKYAVDHKITAY